MTAHTARSPAKINLTLRVCGTRPDGFHELESLVALLSLHDLVRVTPRNDGVITLACDDPTIPTDESNLALRAARALADAAGVETGVDIALAKRIPAGAGLGGGSSNAATTLTLLNDVWRCGLDRAALAEIGADLGSDVPLFLHGPVCVMRGRGEQLEPVERPLDAWVVLILPELHCSTPAVYRAWDALPEHPPRPKLDRILAGLDTPREVMYALFNDLERAAFAVNPELAELAARASEAIGRPIRLTGSGAALFTLCDTAPSAAGLALELGQTLQTRCDVVSVLPA
jgi:4-diphosphocytidyl-2-C-methyl-D-erythritol kinase